MSRIRTKYIILDESLNNHISPSRIEVDDFGNLRTEFYFVAGKLHREDGPALVRYGGKGRSPYGEDRAIITEEWYREGKKHNGALPNKKESDYSDVISYEWYQNDRLHRDGDEPAVIKKDSQGRTYFQAWYQEGDKHRETEPAHIETIYDKGDLFDSESEPVKIKEIWYERGKLKPRHPLPSYILRSRDTKEIKKEIIIGEDGSQKVIEYYSKDRICSVTYESKESKSHRGDGPAIIQYSIKGNVNSYTFCWEGSKCDFWKLYEKASKEDKRTLLRNWMPDQ